MNAWKIVWNAYYEQATRRAYLRELVRVASWPTRLAVLVAAGLFLFGVVSVSSQTTRQWPWAMIIGELMLIAVVDHVRTARFALVYGSVESGLGPAEKEEQRGQRFLMFKKALETRLLNSSHVQDLFEIVEAKEELEAQHNVALNRFLIFISGFLTSATISLIRSIDAEKAAWLMFWIAVSGLALAPVFWMLPTRKGKLKELKYFMVLYCKQSD